MATIEQAVLPLASGDRLSRDEFLSRWQAMPELKGAELIGGIVYMPPPVSAEHGDTESDVNCWLGHYAAYTPGCQAGSNATWFMLRDAPQPDAHLRRLHECGGTSWIEDSYHHGAPELAAEICRSSTAYDLHQKLELYQAAGVPEYVAVLVHEREVRWHRLVGMRYQMFDLPPDGILRSVVFPGLWLDVPALLDGNMARVLKVLDEGLQSAEHTTFVEQLAVSK